MKTTTCFFLLLALFTLSALASDPSPIEDNNFMLESGWNRDDAALQHNSFFMTGRNAWAYELTQEWAAKSPRHQLSYTIPIFTEEKTGLGDVTLNYRFQLHGGADSRIGIAPRVSLILPTRNAEFGGRASGVQLMVPVSANLTSRLTAHANIGTTLFFAGRDHELNLAQSLVFAVHGRLAISADAAYTRCAGGHTLVVRPGVQFAFNVGGLQVSPGVAVPLRSGGVLFFVALERSL